MGGSHLLPLASCLLLGGRAMDHAHGRVGTGRARTGGGWEQQGTHGRRGMEAGWARTNAQEAKQKVARCFAIRYFAIRDCFPAIVKGFGDEQND